MKKIPDLDHPVRSQYAESLPHTNLNFFPEPKARLEARKAASLAS